MYRARALLRAVARLGHFQNRRRPRGREEWGRIALNREAEGPCFEAGSRARSRGSDVNGVAARFQLLSRPLRRKRGLLCLACLSLSLIPKKGSVLFCLRQLTDLLPIFMSVFLCS